MNRRNFIQNVIVTGASFSILPGAGRIWRAVRPRPMTIWEVITEAQRLYPSPGPLDLDEMIRLMHVIAARNGQRIRSLLPSGRGLKLE